MLFFNRNNPSPIKDYKKYREIGRDLIDKIMASACFDQRFVSDAAKRLGILRGKTLVLESEEESVAFMDFLFQDYRIAGKNLIERYRDQNTPASPLEAAVIEAQLNSYTSLFKVVQLLPSERSLILHDCLNLLPDQESQDIKLIDISLSRSASPGLLLFTRLLPCHDRWMTSGSMFVFAEQDEKQLLKKYQSQRKKLTAEEEAVQRFVTFFKLNRTLGRPIGYR